MLTESLIFRESHQLQWVPGCPPVRDAVGQRVVEPVVSLRHRVFADVARTSVYAVAIRVGARQWARNRARS